MPRLLVFLFFCFTIHADPNSLDQHFKKETLKLKDKVVDVYVADTDPRRSRGLMFVEKMPENTGMIFIFDRQQTLSFWMKNTRMPLSIGFFDQGGVLVDVQEMEVPSAVVAQPPSYQSRKPARFALEMNSGWYKRNKINVGTRLETSSSNMASLLGIKPLPQPASGR